MKGNIPMKLIAAITLMLAGATVQAQCVCRCVNGNNVPLCRSTLDLPPICPPTVCQIAPPSVSPIESPRLPPLGTSSCQQQQVFNPGSGRYEWRQVCR